MRIVIIIGWSLGWEYIRCLLTCVQRIGSWNWRTWGWPRIILSHWWCPHLFVDIQEKRYLVFSFESSSFIVFWLLLTLSRIPRDLYYLLPSLHFTYFGSYAPHLQCYYKIMQWMPCIRKSLLPIKRNDYNTQQRERSFHWIRRLYPICAKVYIIFLHRLIMQDNMAHQTHSPGALLTTASLWFLILLWKTFTLKREHSTLIALATKGRITIAACTRNILQKKASRRAARA